MKNPLRHLATTDAWAARLRVALLVSFSLVALVGYGGLIYGLLAGHSQDWVGAALVVDLALALCANPFMQAVDRLAPRN